MTHKLRPGVRERSRAAKGHAAAVSRRYAQKRDKQAQNKKDNETYYQNGTAWQTGRRKA